MDGKGKTWKITMITARIAAFTGMIILSMMKGS
jgi:hypothetical protein